MARSVRKIAALILTLTLVFSLSNTAFAAEICDYGCETDVVFDANAIDESDFALRACISHTWQYTSTLIPRAGSYVSASFCKSNWKETRTCTKCGVTEFSRYYYKTEAHYTVVYSASCTGTTQTWLNECYYCGHSMPTTTKSCPGGPHSGACRFLPV